MVMRSVLFVDQLKMKIARVESKTHLGYILSMKMAHFLASLSDYYHVC